MILTFVCSTPVGEIFQPLKAVHVLPKEQAGIIRNTITINEDCEEQQCLQAAFRGRLVA